MSAGWTYDLAGTVTGTLAAAVEADPGRVFVDFVGDTYTYGAVEARANRLAHGLAALGVGPADTVASILGNNVDAVTAWFAINKIGAVSVPVNTAYKGEFLRHQLADSGAAVVLAEPDYVERVAAVADELPLLRVVVHEGQRPDVERGGLELLSLDDAMGQDETSPPDPNRPGDLTCLIYTAGTTGPSKGCMISHNYACNLARIGLQGNDRTKDEVLWTPLPLFHLNATATSVLTTAMLGGTVAIYPRFSVSGFWPDIQRSGARIASLLGAMIPLLAQAPDTEESLACFGQLRHVSGAPFPAELQATWKERFGIETAGANVYGISEAAPITSLPYGTGCPPGSSGRRNDSFDVRIVDDQDRDVSTGEVGEVIVRPLKPHAMFEGYWRQPAETLRIMRNLWLHTGDLGRFDEGGFFWFVDRKKDYLRRRGENISSFEMETAFLRHPDVSEVAVHAVFSDLTEDDVKVTAVLEPGSTLREEDLCRWAIDHVPYFAIPRLVEFRGELPKNPVGRVLKYQLRDEGVTEATWDREIAGIEIPRR
ncbi:MAG: AMP-binding protein [Acidimicrobiales bacterium]